MNEFRYYIKPFIDEVNKYAKDVHKLNKGVSMDLIEECEEKLGIRLPLTYKYFLMMYNGGELFALPSGTVLSEIYIESNGLRKKGVPYLDEVLNKDRRWSELPSEYIIIADTCDGDVICIDLNNSNINEARIVKWSHEEGKVVESWDKLIDWLMDEMEIGAMITNYDGTDKE